GDVRVGRHVGHQDVYSRRRLGGIYDDVPGHVAPREWRRGRADGGRDEGTREDGRDEERGDGTTSTARAQTREFHRNLAPGWDAAPFSRRSRFLSRYIRRRA